MNLKIQRCVCEGLQAKLVRGNFCCKKRKNAAPWTYVFSDLNGEEIAGNIYEKELQKTNQKEFKIEKLIKTKGDKLYVK